MQQVNNRLKRSVLFDGVSESCWVPNAALAMIIFFMLWGGSLFVGRVIAKPLVSLVPDDTLLQVAFATSLRRILVCGLQIAVFFAWVRLIEKRSVSTMGLGGTYKARTYIRSVLLGIGAIVLVMLILWILGAVQISLSNNLSIKSTLLPTIIALLGWAVQSASEEIAIRGWLVPVIGVRHGPVWAIILTGGVFGAIHLLNAGATLLSFINLTLSGILFALYAINAGNIWGACGLHMGWNFAQSNVFGVHTSGEISENTVFTSHATGSDWLTGGDFGPEAGLVTTILFSVGICLLGIKLSRKK